ncbi:unnamed protein product [marine sediment metagenome]|uniref:Uncharacterized protein n=1 Tax=marine sediment metagenome TaxID=412755 RepID=X1GET6_9ZZZZ
MKKIPTLCPACSSMLEITELRFGKYSTTVQGEFPIKKLLSLPEEKMSKSNRFKVIRQIGILIRDIFEYLLTKPIDEKKEKYYRKLQTKYYYLDI